MNISDIILKRLANFEGDTPGTKENLARMLMHGALGGTGRLLILPVDQGFEHGPLRSFSHNLQALDPHYLFELAIEGGLSAFAAPLGLLEAGADTFRNRVPLILKMNSSNALMGDAAPDQAVTSSVNDALRLGCAGVGFTIYPGSPACLKMMEEIRALAGEAKAKGLFVVIWSYPRGNMSKAGETSFDMVSYGAHMAALLGAHVIKVKLPTDYLETEGGKEGVKIGKIPIATLADRVRYIKQACFNNRRLVVFSGGESKDDNSVLDDARAIHQGGGDGSIMGRNLFQRSKPEALELIKKLVAIYRTAL